MPELTLNIIDFRKNGIRLHHLHIHKYVYYSNKHLHTYIKTHNSYIDEKRVIFGLKCLVMLVILYITFNFLIQVFSHARIYLKYFIVFF